METIDRYRRSLKRRNFSPHTIKNYLSRLSRFTTWLTLPVEEMTKNEIGRYIDHLLKKRLSAQTITSHLQTIRLFLDYLITEEQTALCNPITKVSIRLPKPLPRHLKDDQVHQFLRIITDARDRAMFMLMLRSGLRVEEVSRLTVDAIEFGRNRLFVAQGKGGKDRVVYVSKDARAALETYLTTRASKSRRVFLVQKGPMTGSPLSVRGIQKRIEYYARESKVKVSCHCLRHTMATQLLNADADISTIQDLLGHTHITTTQRYCRVSNTKVQRDYDKAIEIVIQRTVQQGLSRRRASDLEETGSVLPLRKPADESLDRPLRLMQPEDNPSRNGTEQESEKVLEENSMY
jgi:site-specific recombinase XerD